MLQPSITTRVHRAPRPAPRGEGYVRICRTMTEHETGDAAPQNVTPDEGGTQGLFVLSALALLAGAVTGLVCASFRLLLERAGELRNVFIASSHGSPVMGFLLVVAAASAAAGAAALMVRRYAPHASGSGIPHVEAVLHGEVKPAPFGLSAVKFVGGILAIGSGLVLGREGPSVQMGAAISTGLGQIFRRSWPDCRVLLAAGAGAGLATAFNAPIAGAVFVLEELVQRFEHRIAIAALGASASAVTVAHLLIGNEPDFQVAAFVYPGSGSWPIFMMLGAIAGLIAVAYNRTILAALSLADRTRRLPVEARAALIGAMVGSVAWFAPGLVGGGDDISQQVLAGEAALALMPLVFLLRFALGAVSYAAATPGGLFAPMLVLGSQIGYMFGAACREMLGVTLPPQAFAVVGMAAFFSGVVRAPLTGIVLVGEMTASSSMLLPTVFASFSALMVAAALRDRPIYEALRERTLRLDARLKPQQGSPS